LAADRVCGPAVNSAVLAVMTGLGSTLSGLAFALIFTRTDFRAKRLLRVLTIMPIITPPFVIGLALILLFGRSGTVTEFFSYVFGWEKAAGYTVSGASVPPSFCPLPPSPFWC
jgi:iron(III) transport system permease protein